MKKLRFLKNDVIIINYRTSEADKYGNRYQTFGECFIIRNNQRIYFYPKCSGIATTKEQESKQALKNTFGIDVRYFSDHANIVLIETVVKYKYL